MNPEQLVASLGAVAPPPGLSAPLQALWHAARDNWDTAHEIVQADDGAHAAWVHAYLHRVEGDLGNAGYWYRRARRDACTGELEEEWQAIVSALLEAG